MNLARRYSPFRVRPTDGLDGALRMVEDMLSDERKCRELLEVRGDEAQNCLDALQLLADSRNVAANLRSSILKMMLHLSKRSGLCPNCLIIKNVKKLGAFPVGGGGFGDVWKGKIREQLVCLKVVKVYLRSDMALLMKEYMREAIVWQQLKHPNLLPFVGMYYLDKTREQLCLVSPWMERGDLLQYLKETPRQDVDHQTLVYDVAAGLSYLHERKIVHGDLKSVNILVTPDERACIGDFGLSRVADSHGLRLSTSTSGQARGTIRWLSPELLEPPCHSSTRSDIYAYASVCYEIFTGNTPFHELVEGAVIVAVLRDKRHPARPEDASELTDSMWEIMESCWAHEPNLRPAAADVLSQVGALRSVKTGELVRLQPAPDRDALNLMQIRKNVKYPTVDTMVLVCLPQKEQPQIIKQWHHSRDATVRIIAPEEDIRRIFQECFIGKRNAGMLSRALSCMAPGDFFEELGGDGSEVMRAGGTRTTIVEELRTNSMISQGLIASHIPWAFAGAERSRREAGEGEEETREERLLGDLLVTDEKLVASLRQYEVLQRAASEGRVEERQMDAGGREGRDKVIRQIYEEDSPSPSHSQSPSHVSSANLIPGQISLIPVAGPRTPNPNSRTEAATPIISSPSMSLSHVPPRILSPEPRPSSVISLEGRNLDHLEGTEVLVSAALKLSMGAYMAAGTKMEKAPSSHPLMIFWAGAKSTSPA
ncbi:Rho guanine nucleotide exchange factor [Marasmius crinis-equi]|uniref:Rho guanine nucleotide exchange factor n=1 Tax=Marasmius crinis-equi TaxID=585013 RepID=A0ABR3F5N9_9AGAR